MDNKVYKIALTAVMAALIYVATMFFTIPLPGNGYANLGDCFVIIAGFVLGPVYGACAAGIGSALSDLTLGYGIYIPATFIIKAVMALIVYYAFKGFDGKMIKNSIITVCVASVLAEVWMVFGYFIFELAIYGAEVAAVDILGNAVQGLVGAVISSAVYSVILKTGLTKKLMRQ